MMLDLFEDEDEMVIVLLRSCNALTLSTGN